SVRTIFFSPLMRPPPPRATLFPYTTLFRSRRSRVPGREDGPGRGAVEDLPDEVVAELVRRSGFDDQPGPASPLGSATSLLDGDRSEEHTSELQSRFDLVCRLLLEKKKIERN